MSTNRHPGTCHLCGGHVEAEAGLLAGKSADGKRWLVQHDGPCPVVEATEPAATAITFTPTAEQADCLAKFVTGQDLVIQAGAGTGKTATLRLLARWAKTAGKRGQYVAYNKAIVEDVQPTMSDNVNCSTMHRLAMLALGYKYRHRLDSARQTSAQYAALLGLEPWSCSVEVLGGNGKRESKTLSPSALAGMVMGAVRAYCRSAASEITGVCFKYQEGLDTPDPVTGERTYHNNNALIYHLLPFVRAAWEDLSSVDGKLRFNHDVYLKLWQLSGPVINADFIMLDEAQDADPVQVAIIEFQKINDTQIVVVGDSQQVLYEWRGAVNALADFEAMGAQVGTLSQSFRFGNAIAAVANGLLGRLEAPMRLRGYGEVVSTVGPVAEPRCILTRSNAGAVTTVLNSIANHLRPHLVGGGKEVISFCEGALDLQRGRRTDNPELACFSTWAEVQLYVETDAQGDELRLLVKLVDEFGAAKIIGALKHQPSQEDADLVVSTAHKSKGRQWASVQIGDDFMPPVTTDDLAPAELRLAYVASTRAQYELDLSNVPHFINPGARPAPTTEQLIAGRMRDLARDL